MKKTMFCTLAALFCVALLLPTASQAQDKKKKEKAPKAPYEWVMPKLTGNAEFDDYQKNCDKEWTANRQYRESIAFYHIDTTLVKGPDGDYYRALSLVDDAGNKMSQSSTFNQTVDIIANGTLILLDMAALTTSSAAAAAMLPGLGAMKALSYAKYTKAGYKIAAVGGREIKAIVLAKKEQNAQLKLIKQGAVDVGEIKSTDQVILNRVDPDENINTESAEDLLGLIEGDPDWMGNNEGLQEMVDDSKNNEDLPEIPAEE